MVLTQTSQHPSLSQGREITGLFLGWQDYQSDLWLPVAKMTWAPDLSQYCFRYTKGMERAIEISPIDPGHQLEVTDDRLNDGRFQLGRLPGYLREMARACPAAIQIEVCRVNPKAPQFHSLLCHVTINGALLTPFAAPEYQTYTSFKLENAKPKSGEKFLTDFYADYAQKYPSTYAIDRVLNALEQERVAVPSGFNLPTGIDNGAKVFVGYLMLDNLIGNCDRHDQNFEIQVLPDGTQELAPTFDQGQAMGATLSDKQRQTFSTNEYHEYLEGSFYDGVDNILTPKAFEIAAKCYPEAALIWQERLARITPEQIDEIFARIPRDRIGYTQSSFAKQVINDGRA